MGVCPTHQCAGMNPADPRDPDKLNGLARSIGSLFSDDETTTPPRDDVVWEEVPENEGRHAYSAGDADPDALRAAVDAFLRADVSERDAAARAVRESAGPLREAGALDALADAVERLALESSDSEQEATAAMAQFLLTPGVASRLVARLGASREERRRVDLMKVTRRMGREMAVAIADALSDTTDRFARRTFMEAMVSMGPAGMAVVESMVEDSRWFVVRNAVAILGEVGGERAIELLTSALAHADSRVRREALLALAKVGAGNESAVEDAGLLVYGMIEDPDPDVRLAAAMAAGALKVERALRPLIKLLDEENDSDVVVGILRALGQLGDPGAVQAIEKRAGTGFFSRPPTDVRIAAYRALHAIGTPHARSLLEAAREDKDPEVRAAVHQMLGAR